ncbi:hypothetical protein ACFYW1_28195 [Streptomyces sp. NPDC002669]|uniref:hypothetical protein n=1 Tax=Streptomyces sp. NPDC002669 TaxID=3364658 RepID=UPI0036A602D1
MVEDVEQPVALVLDEDVPAPGKASLLACAQKSSLHGVTVGFGAEPHRELPDVFSAVRVNMAIGLPAIGHLLETRKAVGLFLVCRQHHTVLILMKSDAADSWCAAHSECSRHTNVRTLRCEPGYGPLCQAGVWVEPPGPDKGPVTDQEALHHALSGMRSPAIRGEKRSLREVCCA